MAIDPKSGIKKQDSNEVISGVAKNKVGRDLAWNWLRANWKAINRSVTFISKGLISQTWAEHLKFIRSNSIQHCDLTKPE